MGKQKEGLIWQAQCFVITLSALVLGAFGRNEILAVTLLSLAILVAHVQLLRLNFRLCGTRWSLVFKEDGEPYQAMGGKRRKFVLDRLPAWNIIRVTAFKKEFGGRFFGLGRIFGEFALQKTGPGRCPCKGRRDASPHGLVQLDDSVERDLLTESLSGFKCMVCEVLPPRAGCPTSSGPVVAVRTRPPAWNNNPFCP